MADEGFVAGKIGGQAGDVFLLFVAGQNFFLEWDIDAEVAILAGLVVIIEGEKEGIDEEDPVETLWIEIWGQGYAIGEAGFDVEFVEDAVPVGGAACGFGGFFLVDQPFGVFGGEVVVSS